MWRVLLIRFRLEVNSLVYSILISGIQPLEVPLKPFILLVELVSISAAVIFQRSIVVHSYIAYHRGGSAGNQFIKPPAYAFPKFLFFDFLFLLLLLGEVHYETVLNPEFRAYAREQQNNYHREMENRGEI